MTDEFSVESVYAELLGRAPENKMEPRLAPLHRAMDILGEPNKAFPIIHVTGTNGKTSTARMIEAGLRAHGLSTGRYTSPHLSKVTERISIDGDPVSDETFVRIWDEIRPYLEIVDGELEAEGQPRLTYFECLTILGFAVFADQPVNVAVIEVGLGGITDATNVGDGQVFVVTPISLDHTDLLGDTTEDIAYEKAGIIKPGGFLVSAAQPMDAAQVLLEKAKEVNVPFRFEGVEFGVESRTVAVGGQMVTIQGIAGRYEELLVPLHGAHQAENAAVAIAALEAFFGGGEAARRRAPAGGLRHRHLARAARGGPHRARPSSWTRPTTPRASGSPPRPSMRPSASPSSWWWSASWRTRTPRRSCASSRSPWATSPPNTASPSPTRRAPSRPRTSPRLALDLGFGEDNIHVADKLDDALEWAVERAEANEDLAGGVLVTGSITLVAEARILLGKADA